MANTITIDNALRTFINNINNSYVHSGKYKDMQIPVGYDRDTIWQVAMEERNQGFSRNISNEGIAINWWISNTMEAQLHKLDIGLAGGREIEILLSPKWIHRYKTNALIDESIASAQLAGLAVSKKAAKEMLLKKRSPQNNDEQICINIYRALQLGMSKKEQLLTEGLLLQLHQVLTKDTIKLKGVGHYRTNNKVDLSAIDSSAGYKPVDAKKISQTMELLFALYNNDAEPFFIHPLVKACLLHYLIATIRPFRDANGRIARLLAQMYLLKKDYWVTEFISISNVVSKFKQQYHKSFALAQTEQHNIGYFIQFYIQSIQMAHKSVRDFALRISKEKQEKSVHKIAGYNERQTAVLQWLKEDKDKAVTIREIRSVYGVSKETARTDLTALVEKGWIKYYHINKKTYAFVKGEAFDELVQQIA